MYIDKSIIQLSNIFKNLYLSYLNFVKALFKIETLSLNIILFLSDIYIKVSWSTDIRILKKIFILYQDEIMFN